MTMDQWESIQGSLISIRVLMFSLAKSCENQDGLRVAFQEQKELFETFALNSALSEGMLESQRKHISEIEKAIWD